MPFTALEQKEIDEVLTSFRLKASEKKVYLALLRLGQTTVTPLARALRLPVTTVQSISQRLVILGLVVVTKRKTRHLYEAQSPEVFRRMLERQLEEVKHIIPLLSQLQGQGISESKIKIYSHERMTDIFHEVLNCKSKIMYEIISPKDFQEILGEKFHLTTRRIEKGIYLKTLRVEKREIKRYSKESHREKLREVKFLPREFTFRGSIIFWDDSAAFFSTYHEGLACVITSTSIRETVQQIFDLLWSISRPYAPHPNFSDEEK